MKSRSLFSKVLFSIFLSLFLFLGFAYRANAVAISKGTCTFAPQLPDAYIIGPVTCGVDVSGGPGSGENVSKIETIYAATFGLDTTPTNYTDYSDGGSVPKIFPRDCTGAFCNWYNNYRSALNGSLTIGGGDSTFRSTPRLSSVTLANEYGATTWPAPYQSGNFAFEAVVTTTFNIYCTNGSVQSVSLSPKLVPIFRGVGSPDYVFTPNSIAPIPIETATYQCPGGVQGSVGSCTGDSCTVPSLIPPPPTSLVAIATPGSCGTTGINLSWNSSSGADSYNVLRSTTINGAYTQIGTSVSTSYTDSSGTAGSTYFYKLQAVNVAGTSASSVSSSSATVPSACNVAPTANAGSDRTITLPTNSVTTSGASSSDTNGNITSNVWSLVSSPVGAPAPGIPTVPISDPNATFSNLTTAGTYIFKLRTTDSGGLFAEDTMTVTVNTATTATVDLQVRQNSAYPYTNGPISVVYNTSADLQWTTTNASSCTASGNWSGSKSPANTGAISQNVGPHIFTPYVYILTCVNSAGTSVSDSVTVNVNSPPTANAGSDRTITLPTNSVLISGASSSDSDGSISSNAWSFVSGPVTPTITNGGPGLPATTPTFSNLTTTGVYTFRLTATDNGGLTASDIMTVTVNPATSATVDLTISDDANVDRLQGSGGTLTNQKYNGTHTLKWTSSNVTANSCGITASPARTSFPKTGEPTASSGVSTGGLTTNVTFTITCSGTSGASVSDSVTVNILAPNLIASFPTALAATADVPRTYNATISNTGVDPTGSSFPYFFQTSLDGGVTPTNYISSTMSALDAGVNNTATSPSISFPIGSSPLIKVCADKTSPATVNGSIVESNEGDNCSPWTSVAVTFIPQPTVDLTISDDANVDRLQGSGGTLTNQKYNGTHTLKWTSSNVTTNSCGITANPARTSFPPKTGEPTASSGVSTGGLTTNVTFTITCSGTSGASVSDSVTVNVVDLKITSSGDQCDTSVVALKLTAAWNTVSGAAGYNIYRSKDEVIYESLGFVDSNTFTYNDTGGEPGQMYTYKVVPVIGSLEQELFYPRSERYPKYTGPCSEFESNEPAPYLLIQAIEVGNYTNTVSQENKSGSIISSSNGAAVDYVPILKIKAGRKFNLSSSFGTNQDLKYAKCTLSNIDSPINPDWVAEMSPPLGDYFFNGVKQASSIVTYKAECETPSPALKYTAEVKVQILRSTLKNI